MTDNGCAGYGIGFLGGLTLVFIALKLTDHISWSWVWVLAPLWIPVALIAFIIFVAVLVKAIKEATRDEIPPNDGDIWRGRGL